MSRRNTYLIGAGAIALGIVMIVIALTALSGDGDDDRGGGSSPATTPGKGTTQSPPAAQQPQPQGEQAQGSDLARQLARRRKVAAPGFSLDVVEDGTAPAQTREPLERALEDGELALDRLRGSPVVVHMWSSQCTPCRADARLVQNTWERWGQRGVVFVGVSVKEPTDAARRFARTYELTYPIVSDAGGSVAAQYGATSLPETFFISATGDVVGRVAGSPSVRQMELGAAAARSGRAFGVEQGGSRVPLD